MGESIYSPGIPFPARGPRWSERVLLDEDVLWGSISRSQRLMRFATSTSGDAVQAVLAVDRTNPGWGALSQGESASRGGFEKAYGPWFRVSLGLGEYFTGFTGVRHAKVSLQDAEVERGHLGAGLGRVRSVSQAPVPGSGSTPGDHRRGAGGRYVDVWGPIRPVLQAPGDLPSYPVWQFGSLAAIPDP